jgi:hypothetical protein
VKHCLYIASAGLHPGSLCRRRAQERKRPAAAGSAGPRAGATRGTSAAYPDAAEFFERHAAAAALSLQAAPRCSLHASSLASYAPTATRRGDPLVWNAKTTQGTAIELARRLRLIAARGLGATRRSIRPAFGSHCPVPRRLPPQAWGRNRSLAATFVDAIAPPPPPIGGN